MFFVARKSQIFWFFRQWGVFGWVESKLHRWVELKKYLSPNVDASAAF